MKISAKKKDQKEVVTVEANIPDTLAEKIKLFGEDVVNSAATDSLVITVQALVRRGIAKGTSQADIQKAVTEWKPDVRSVVRVSAFDKAKSSLETFTPEQRAELLKALQGQAQAAKGAGQQKAA